MNKTTSFFHLFLTKPLNVVFVFLVTLASFQPATSYAQQSIFDTSDSSLFSNDDEFLKVDQAFIFNFDQANNQLEISFDITEGYYLYRHQFKFTSENAKISTVELPQGIDHEDEFFGVQQIYTEQLTFTINIEQAAKNATVTVRYQGCAEKGLCYPPTKKTVDLDEVLSQVNGNDPSAVISALTIAEKAPVSEQHQLADMLKQDSLLLTLIAFFVGGLLLSFTPCVFPMYPILTGIIVGAGKQLTTKKAFTLSFFYVQGMAV
ncbi:MAG: protein-disulfide reductase DsbD family protein, partial [Colwellia sp.]|nr:protein-disulfide reductase DsbD family protein [Colwellia sp.]